MTMTYGKSIFMLDEEYFLMMSVLHDALAATPLGQHEDLSVLYHTLGSQYGYTKETA
jgi:hypothetical protein